MSTEFLKNIFPEEVKEELTLEFLTDIKNRYLEIVNKPEEWFNRNGFGTPSRDDALVWACEKHKGKTPNFDKWEDPYWLDSDGFFGALKVLLEIREEETIKGKFVPLTAEEKMEEIIRQQDLKHNCVPEDKAEIRKKIEEKKKREEEKM